MAKINGKETPIDPDNLNITPQIRKGRTFLPLRFLSETLGYTVEWIASTQTIHIKYIVNQSLEPGKTYWFKPNKKYGNIKLKV